MTKVPGGTYWLRVVSIHRESEKVLLGNLLSLGPFATQKAAKSSMWHMCRAHRGPRVLKVLRCRAGRYVLWRPSPDCSPNRPEEFFSETHRSKRAGAVRPQPFPF